TNLSGVATTNLIYIPVDEVTYMNGGRWGQWSDGGGSSLELIDPHSDNRLPSNWADSDDTAKSVWSTISYTGILDNPNVRANSLWNALEVMLLDSGECLLDNVSFSMPVAGGTNLIRNHTFESGLDPWVLLGDHLDSYLAN